MKTRLCAGFIVVATAAIFVSAQAIASPITYTETGIGTGSLGGITFTDASITIMGTGDTASVFTVGTHVANPISTITLDVSGFAETTFTSTTGLAYRALGVPTYFAGFAASDTGGAQNAIMVTFDFIIWRVRYDDRDWSCCWLGTIHGYNFLNNSWRLRPAVAERSHNICCDHCSRPRAVDLGNAASRLRWHWLRGVSTEEQVIVPLRLIRDHQV